MFVASRLVRGLLYELAMKKIKPKLTVNVESIKLLQLDQLGAVNGRGYTCGGTMCESCSYQSAIRVCPTVVH